MKYFYNCYNFTCKTRHLKMSFPTCTKQRKQKRDNPKAFHYTDTTNKRTGTLHCLTFPVKVWQSTVLKAVGNTKKTEKSQSKGIPIQSHHKQMHWHPALFYLSFQSVVKHGPQSRWEPACRWWPAVPRTLSSGRCWCWSLHAQKKQVIMWVQSVQV